MGVKPIEARPRIQDFVGRELTPFPQLGRLDRCQQFRWAVPRPASKIGVPAVVNDSPY